MHHLRLKKINESDLKWRARKLLVRKEEGAFATKNFPFKGDERTEKVRITSNSIAVDFVGDQKVFGQSEIQSLNLVSTVFRSKKIAESFQCVRICR